MGRSNDGEFDPYEDDGADGADGEGKRGGPKALRDAFDKRGDEITALKTRLVKSEAKARRADVVEVLTKKGQSPALARFVLADLEEDQEPSSEFVETWLTENKDVFNIKAPEDPDAGDNGSDGSGLSPEEKAQLQSISATESGALPPDKERDLLAQLNAPGLTPEKLAELTGLNIDSFSHRPTV